MPTAPTPDTLKRLCAQYGVLYLSRADWQPRLAVKSAQRLPLVGVHVHHTVTIADDDHDLLATDDVVRDMHEIEDVGEARFGIFPYPFCFHPSGVVAEGAGFTIAAHTADYNSTTSGFSFIGNYDVDDLPPEMVASFRVFSKVLYSLDVLSPTFYFAPHKQRKATACPGRYTMERWADLTNISALPSPAPAPAPQPNPFPEPPSPTGATVTVTSTFQVIRRGSMGADVRRLQTIIRDHAGGGITVDGIFGPQTEGRVKDLQRFFGLVEDGIVGAKTWGVAVLCALPA